MNDVYCAECGTRIKVYRKALSRFGRIIHVIEPHECTESVQEIDLTPIDLSPVPPKEEGKFVKKLNELNQLPPVSPLIDRREGRPRVENVSTAPDALIKAMRSDLLGHSSPAHGLEEPEEEDA